MGGTGKYTSKDNPNFIDESAKIGKNFSCGLYTVIEKNVEIGDDCVVGHNTVIHEGSKIGNSVRIDDNTVIGASPLRSKMSIFKKGKDYPPAQIDDDCLIGSQVAVYVGSEIGNNVLIADGAQVREDSKVGEYTIIGRNVTLENFVIVGKKCKLETNSYLTAYSLVEDFCFIAPGVVTTNDNFMARTDSRFKSFKGVTIRKGGRIGGGAVILPGIEIGADAVVAAGAVVTKDVPPGVTFAGVPAKEFRKVPEEQLLKNQGWDIS